MKSMHAILQDIKKLQKGECYEIKDGKTRIEIGRCFDISGYIMRGFIPAEALFYESARRQNEVVGYNAIMKKVKEQFKN